MNGQRIRQAGGNTVAPTRRGGSPAVPESAVRSAQDDYYRLQFGCDNEHSHFWEILGPGDRVVESGFGCPDAETALREAQEMRELLITSGADICSGS
jgi:hypothetical protein